MIAAENVGFRKDGVAGYAEIVGDMYIVHSERANSIRFHANILNDKDYLAALQRAGIAQLVYTNDADKKFVYDVKTKTVVSETQLPDATRPQ